MVRLDLTDEEANTLRDILEYYLSELRMEIADTDSMEYREGLKKIEVFVKDLLPQLPGAASEVEDVA